MRVTRCIGQFPGQSSLQQDLTLIGHQPSLDIVTTVDWHERQKLLKLAVPLDIHADRAASEIQYRHIFRPTHANTSWDAAVGGAAPQGCRNNLPF